MLPGLSGQAAPPRAVHRWPAPQLFIQIIVAQAALDE